MARRAAVPSPAKQQGGKTALVIKKLPKAIGWVTLIFVLIGVALGAVLGLLGNLAHSITPIVPGFWIFFKLGFVFGFGGLFVLYLRFSGFEDVQEGGRAFIASVGIVLGMAAALRILVPLFEGQPDLRSLAIGGIVLTAIVLIINIFMKHEYKHVVGWTAFLVAAAFVCLLFVNMTDGKGFEIRWPWGKSAAEDHTPKDVWLSKQNPVLFFENVSWETSDTYRVSSASSRFDWEFAESSACGNVLVNGRYLLRNLCPGRPGERIMLEKSVLFPGENTTQFQFIGKGMRGKVIATW